MTMRDPAQLNQGATPGGSNSSTVSAVGRLTITQGQMGATVKLSPNSIVTLPAGLDYSLGLYVEGPDVGVGYVVGNGSVSFNGSTKRRIVPAGSVLYLRPTGVANQLAASSFQAEVRSRRSVYRVRGGVADASGSAPHPSRVLSPKSALPAMLWEPANGAMPGTIGNASAAVDRNYVCRSQYGSVALTAAASGSVSATWSGLSINFAASVAAGYRVGLLYVCLPHLMESLTLTLAGAGGRQRIITYNFAVARKGWVGLPFALPGLGASMLTSVNNALTAQNISGMSEFNGGFDTVNTTVTSVGISFSTFGMAGTTVAAGEVFAVAGIDLAPVVKPAVMLTYDKVNGTGGQDSFAELVNEHVSRNLVGGVRYYGTYDNVSFGLNYIKYGTDRGFDVFNGTLTRQPTSGWVTADAYREFALNDAQAKGNGLEMSAFYTSPGNATWADGTYETTMADLGIRYSRASGLPCIVHSYAGVTNPLSMGTCGLGTPTNSAGAITMTQWLQGLVDAGVHGSCFSHGGYTGTDPGDSRQPWAVVTAALDALKTFQDAGLIDVVGCEGMQLILDGIA